MVSGEGWELQGIAWERKKGGKKPGLTILTSVWEGERSKNGPGGGPGWEGARHQP